MDWKKVAIEDLRKYEAQKMSLTNMAERIQVLNENYTAIKGSMLSPVPVHGGGTKIEDKLLDNIVERDRLKVTYKATKCLVNMIERGLRALDKNEYEVLYRFFINPTKDHVEQLMSKLQYEKSQIYRIKDAALYKFTTAMYGIIDY